MAGTPPPTTKKPLRSTTTAEHRSVQQALRREKAYFERLFESAHEAIVIADNDGRVLHVNGEFTRIFGYERDEALGQHVDDLVAPPSLAEEARALTRDAAEGRRAAVEAVRWRKDGALIHVSILTAPIVVDGEQVSVYAIYRDITMHKQAERELRREKAYFQRLFESAHEAIVIGNNDGVVQHFNGEFTRLFGYEPEEALGRHVDDLVAPEEVQDEARALTHDAARGNRATVEGVRRRKDGSRIQVSILTAPIDVDGEQVGVYAIYRDITRRKEAEQALRREKAYFERLIESAQEAIVIADNEGVVQHVNGEFARIFGYSSAEARGRHVDELVAFSDQLEEAEELTLDAARGQRAEVEAIRRRKDGSSVDVSILTAPIVIDGEQVGVFGIYRDISERKRREEERRRWEAQVQHLQKLESLGVLAGGIAHDFNNILTGVICNAELALVKVADPEGLRPLLEGIKQASVRAADLCRQMLAYSGKGSFVIEFIDLSRLVHDMASMLEISISKKVTLEYELGAALPPVLGDAGQISQVIMNLITNASEAIGERSGTIRLASRLVDTAEDQGAWGYVAGNPSDGRFVTMEVSDDGAGMKDEILGKIFDPFFSTKFTGRGLGLSAVLGIVRGHGGIIRVRSAPGEGTTIHVLFPAKEGQVSAAQSLKSLRQLHGWRGEGTVLVVDDEDFVQDAVTSILRQLGFEVVTADTGREAVELFRARHGEISCVLLDLTMPEMDGEETYQALRRIRDDVPVIMMSGYGERELAARYTESGVAGFIQKPFLMRTLTEVLHDALEGGGTS